MEAAPEKRQKKEGPTKSVSFTAELMQDNEAVDEVR